MLTEKIFSGRAYYGVPVICDRRGAPGGGSRERALTWSLCDLTRFGKWVGKSGCLRFGEYARVLLLWTRGRSVLDLWLMVAACELLGTSPQGGPSG